jgi:hypothetical protein
MLTPISDDTCPPPVTTSPSLWASYRYTTCQPHGSHQAGMPHVAQALATRKLGTSTVETDSPQPLRLRYAIWRGGLDSMVAPTSHYSGLHDSKGLVFHLQTHEPSIRDVSIRQIPRLSFLFDQQPKSHHDLATWDFVTPRAWSSTSKLTNPRYAMYRDIISHACPSSLINDLDHIAISRLGTS